MYFSLEKLLNYEGNRYQLARSCMEYAKRVRHVSSDEYVAMGEKEALISIKHILDGEIKHTSDAFEIEIYEDEAEIIISQREMEMQRKIEKEEALAKSNSSDDDDDDKVNNEVAEKVTSAKSKLLTNAAEGLQQTSNEEEDEEIPTPSTSPIQTLTENSEE